MASRSAISDADRPAVSTVGVASAVVVTEGVDADGRVVGVGRVGWAVVPGGLVDGVDLVPEVTGTVVRVAPTDGWATELEGT